MKRYFRRSFSILVGLALGWAVAGMMFGESVSLAEEGRHAAHVEHADADHGHEHHEGDVHGDESDPAAQAADLLVPSASGITWYGTVLGIAGGLFLVAIPLGYFAMKLSGPESPDPAADHGHDKQGH